MAFKLILLSALVATAVNAGVLPLNYESHQEIPLAIQADYVSDGHQQYHHLEEEHHAPAHYSFNYDVHDLHTGDIKSQHESRVGDKVEGEYSLVEPDGSRRTVKYTADKHSGFNAVVHREPAQHPIAVHAAPVATHHLDASDYLQSAHIAQHEPLTYSTYHH